MSRPSPRHSDLSTPHSGLSTAESDPRSHVVVLLMASLPQIPAGFRVQ